MVSGLRGRGRSNPTTGTDRAQVLLVGAVVLAFMILALVPVFNGVFAPDSAGNNEPREVADGPITARQEQQTTARELAVRVGHTDVYASEAPLVDRLSIAFANYTAVSAEASVASRERFAETRLNASAPGTVVGTRVVQREPGPFTEPVADAPEWTPVGPGLDAELGWFVARLDTTNLSRSDPFVVRVENGTHEMVVRVQRQDSSNNVRLSVAGDAGVTDEPVTCDATAGQVVLDFHRGQSGDIDCTFPGFEELDGPVTIRFEDGDSARGVYEFVVDDDTSLQTQIGACVGGGMVPEDPCHSPVLWQLSLESVVSDGRTAYVSRTNVSVYGGDA